MEIESPSQNFSWNMRNNGNHTGVRMKEIIVDLDPCFRQLFVLSF